MFRSLDVRFFKIQPKAAEAIAIFTEAQGTQRKMWAFFRGTSVFSVALWEHVLEREKRPLWLQDEKDQDRYPSATTV